MSTIAAISSPIGAGGIGIVRVSGKDALGIADAIFSFSHKKRIRHTKRAKTGLTRQDKKVFVRFGFRFI